ncbi:MAG: phosphoribosylformylglycinamidine synthase [Phycisphaeraceae bacterium]|nr:phosphoribosylformylglycinamidine synthase [Phycisphaeraceae bacterium]
MTATDTAIPAAGCVHRVEVRPRAGEPDPRGGAALALARQDALNASAVRSAEVYLIEAALTDQQLQRIAGELLADPVSQQITLGTEATSGGTIEVHYLPGVMDPVAQSTRDAIVEMLGDLTDPNAIEVRTAVRYDLADCSSSPEQLESFARRHLANPVIQSIYLEPHLPQAFEHGTPYVLKLTHVPIRELDDDALRRMSREAHLFLSLPEMQAIQAYYREAGREPTDVELETLAQTWSEHCVHKTLKSRIHYTQKPNAERSEASDALAIFRDKPHHTIHDDGSVTIDNLLKATVAAATHKLMEESHFRNWCVSVFEDNAGIVKFDDEDAMCIKVETHNHPSAIEPYGGAATGIGGVIRDVLGTGLAAKPIANTDVFCVAHPDIDKNSKIENQNSKIPKGVIHPRRILQGIVSGVRDYGNRMGIPTINGAVFFHDGFLGNPLVFAGCVGMIPLDKCFGSARPGDHIIILGGRTGRDGIHGATFSSAELTDTHADEFSHAVQIGNAITEKKVTDVVLQARDRNLFSAITDCGAGGFSSAVGEMGQHVGATVHLDRAPLKYAGLSYTEIWISEAQERMTLAVPPEKVDELRLLCDSENVEFCDLGTFGLTDHDKPTLSLNYHGIEVGRLAMSLLHDGIPQLTRNAEWTAPASAPSSIIHHPSSIADTLTAKLSEPNTASKHWIIRQYDHEVQGGSVVKPLVGPQQDGPSDAAVLRPKLSSQRGIAIACGMTPHTEPDAYHATLLAIDEAVRNVVCVGAAPDPASTSGGGGVAILDNFCWPSCDPRNPRNLGSLVRAAEACYDGALAYRTPFVSGKDSLNNQFTCEDGSIIAIPPTLLITALGIVPDVHRCVTMFAKQPHHALLLVSPSSDLNPHVDLKAGPLCARTVAKLIADQLVASAHDCSEGGLLVAAAEMAFAGRIGLDLDLEAMLAGQRQRLSLDEVCFAEAPSRYLLEVAPENLGFAIEQLRAANIHFAQVGTFATHNHLTLRSAEAGRLLDTPLDDLRHAWLKPLDW